MIRTFDLMVGQYVKILYRLDSDFKVIGQVTETDYDVNVAKVTFKDVNDKQKSYWFHLFTGNVVTLPKTKGEFPTDVDQTSKKAYYLSIEPVYSYDIIPELDQNYIPPKIDEEEDSETNQNEKVTEIK